MNWLIYNILNYFMTGTCFCVTKKEGEKEVFISYPLTPKMIFIGW